MKLVNAAIVATFLAVSACSANSVPEQDAARAAYDAGDLAAAQIHVRNALKESPDKPDLVFLAGQIALDSGNAELARDHFGKLLANPEYAPRASVLMAKAFVQSGNGRRALELLGSAEPASALGYAVAVSANLIEGRSDEANALLDRGLKAYPDSPDILVLEGTRWFQSADPEGARKIVDKALAVAPNDVNARLLAARIAMAQKRMADATAHFDAVLKLRPRHQTALLGKAAILYDKGDGKGAQALLAQAAEQVGGNSLAIDYFRAQLAFDGGDIEGANRILQGMKGREALPEAQALEGIVASRRGQHEQAVSLLRKFAGKSGEDGRVRYALAASYNALGMKAEAWEALRPLADAANANRATLLLAATLSPAPATYQARADALANGDPLAKQLTAADHAIRGGEWAKADSVYAGVLASQPDTTNVLLLNNAANVKLQLGKPAEAVALARRAAALAPADPYVADTLGWSLYKAEGKTPEAVALIRRAVEALPANQEVLEHYSAISR